MAEVLLSSDDLVVLGGPAEISLDIDFGPKGDRGSLILYGLGKPSEVSLPETPQIYDTYINVLSSDDEYQFLYQYISGDGGIPVWTKIFKLTPNIYSGNFQRNFSNGTLNLNIPLSLVVPEQLIGDYTAENFNVQVNVLNQNPVSTGVVLSEISIVDNLVTIPLTINAIEYSEGSWQNLSGQKTIHVLITVV